MLGSWARVEELELVFPVFLVMFILLLLRR